MQDKNDKICLYCKCRVYICQLLKIVLKGAIYFQNAYNFACDLKNNDFFFFLVPLSQKLGLAG